jgi:hypothetical protein
LLGQHGRLDDLRDRWLVLARIGHAAIAVERVPNKPGTDGALLLAMNHEIVAQGRYDREFLARHANACRLVKKDEASDDYGPTFHGAAGRAVAPRRPHDFHRRDRHADKPQADRSEHADRAPLGRCALPEDAPAPRLGPVAACAVWLVTLVARAATLMRSTEPKSRSKLQRAIGVEDPRITQRAQGIMGGSFNPREFFHGHGAPALRTVEWHRLVATIAPPGPMLAICSPAWVAATFVIPFAGLLAARWFFVARANHPQNLYYQVIS